MSRFHFCKIADFLVCPQQISEKEWEIYQYGYDTLIYSIQQTILFLLLGSFFHQLTGKLLFSIISDNILVYVPHFYIILGFLQLMYYILIYQYSPVEHSDKPLSNNLKKKNRRNGFILSILFTIVTLLCSIHSSKAAGILTCSLMYITVLTINYESYS